MSVLTNISLITNFIFVGIILIGFGVGYLRGFKISLLNMAFGFCAIILAIFITPPITKALLKIKMGDKTLSGLLTDEIMKNKDVQKYTDASPSLKNLIEKLPAAIANIVVFLVVGALCLGLFYIIYKIFQVCFFGKKKRGPTSLGSRFGGAAIGAVKSIVIALFLFMPITALAGFVGDVAKNDALTDSKGNSVIEDVVPQKYLNMVSRFDKSAFGIFGGLVKLDDAMFDYFTQVKVEGATIKIRKEALTYLDIYANAKDFYDVYGDNSPETTFKKFDFKKLDKSVNALFKSGLYRSIVTELATKVITDYDGFAGLDAGRYASTLDAIGNDVKNYKDKLWQYYQNDIKALYSTVKSLSASGILDELTAKDINLDNALETLTSDANYAKFNDSMKNLFDMNMLRAGISPLSRLLLDNFLEGGEQVDVDTSEWNGGEWDDLADSLTGLAKTFNELKDLNIGGFVSDPLSIVKDDSVDLIKTLNDIGSLIDQVRAIKLFQTSDGGSVIDNLLEDANLKIFKGDSIKVFNKDKVQVTISNYKGLFSFLAQPLERLKTTGIFDALDTMQGSDLLTFIANKLTEEGNENLLEETILPAIQIEPAAKFITDALAGDGTSGGLGSNLIDFGALGTDYDKWDSDLDHITTLLTSLNTMTINEQSAIEYMLSSTEFGALLLDDGFTLSEVLPPILKATSTANLRAQISELIAEVMGSLIDDEVTFDLNSASYEGANDQTEEVINIIESFKGLYADYENGNTTLVAINKEELGKVLNRMKTNKYERDDGVFAGVFDGLVAKVEALCNEHGVELKGHDEDYSQVDFEEKMTLLQAALQVI